MTDPAQPTKLAPKLDWFGKLMILTMLAVLVGGHVLILALGWYKDSTPWATAWRGAREVWGGVCGVGEGIGLLLGGLLGVLEGLFLFVVMPLLLVTLPFLVLGSAFGWLPGAWGRVRGWFRRVPPAGGTG